MSNDLFIVQTLNRVPEYSGKQQSCSKRTVLLLWGLLLFTLLMGTRTYAQTFNAATNLDYNGFGQVEQGTSLMFGPDGRLYVLSIQGQIDIYTIVKNGPDDYMVTSHEELLNVKNIPNHNDDGASSGGNNREATGITVVGTATTPVIYATSSDSRTGGPSGDVGLDTNSGVITRLTKNGSGWDVVDIVRGLPRSEENHATNGLEFATIGSTDYLIVCSGGHANAGAPSDNFAWTTEYALSAAVLSINLTMLEGMPVLNDSGRQYIYDIPTLDDPTRPNIGPTDPDDVGYTGIDQGDPWGGNDGLNQAMIVPGGPVQIFSAGYRNSYDLTVTQSGAVYITDNGANSGWGGLPENEGTANVTNNYIPGEPGGSGGNPTADGEVVDNKDHLTLATDNIQTYNFGDFYGGHPTPVRANPEGAGLYTNPSFNSTANAIFRTMVYDPDGLRNGVSDDGTYVYTSDPNMGLPANWPPVPISEADIRQADWRGPSLSNPDGPVDDNVYVWNNNNVNGIDEYTSTVFAAVGQNMQGDLIAGRNSGGNLHRVQLNANGSVSGVQENWVSGLGGNALGITCNSDTDPFAGTVWVATFNSNIKILEPNLSGAPCLQPSDPGYVGTADSDSDGYTNDDEVSNSIDHCNPGAQPNDFDKEAGGVLVSDRNDPDDDNDGINDSVDPMQIGDPLDAGSDAFPLPVINDLFSDNLDLKGYLGLGFTGMMNNGNTAANWLDWIDVPGDGPNPNDLYGGATGTVTMQMTEGTALGGSNSQEKGFQYGFQMDTSTGGVTVEGRLLNFTDAIQLYGASAPANGEIGLFIGDGTQSNYIKFVINQNGLEALQEIGDVTQGSPITFAIPEEENRPANDVTMFFVIDASSGDVTLQYSFDGGGVLTLGTITAQGSILAAIQNTNTPLMTGLIGSSNTAGVEVEGSWDYLYVQASQPTIQQQLPDLNVALSASPTSFNLDEYFSDDGGDGNLTYSVELNTDPAVGATINGNMLDLTFPASPATSNITVRATDAGSLFIEQIFTVTVSDAPIPLIRIRANGPTLSATDTPNPDWIGIAAGGAQGGTFNGISYNVNTGSLSTQNVGSLGPSVPAYVPLALYTNERYDVGAAPEMEWTFGLTNGNYVVRLYMGNGFSGTSSVGQRVFDISIEGNLVQNDLDLVDMFGHSEGGMIEYNVTLSDGTLNILFNHVVENPLINGIEILSTTAAPDPPISIDPVANQFHNPGDSPILNITASGGDPLENFAFSASGLPPGLSIEPTNGSILGSISSNPADAGQYVSTITVSKPSSTPATVNIGWNVFDPNEVNGVVYRISAGGPTTASNDASPREWYEDQSNGNAGGNAVTGIPSPYVNSNAVDNTFGATLTAGFNNVTGYPNSLFSKERWGAMEWDFPVPNGEYTVNLIFAEIWPGATNINVREFNVQIEGSQVLTNFDQTELYGWEQAGVESFLVTVNDGNIDIDFLPILNKNNPNIKAIEILTDVTPIPDTWTNITNVSEHTPRHENSFVQVGTKFYLFGGRESADKMDIYDYQTDTWTEAASTAPFEFNHFQAVAYDGLIWVIGAFTDNNFPNEVPADHVYMYDPLADTWTQGPAVPAGRKRGSAGLVLYNNKFYVVAGNTDGHDGGYIPWFDEFDPATGLWTELPPAPRARDHFHMTVVGNKLYVVGGRLSGGPGGTFAPIQAEVDVYDFGTSSWSTLPTGSNLPTPRAASGTVNFKGDVVVIGGEGNGQAYVDTHSLDVNTGIWTPLDDLNNARHGTQGIVSGDGIWITSGSPIQGGGNQTNMEVYGVDNPTGTAIVAGTLGAPATASAPAGGTDSFLADNTGGNQGILVTSFDITGTDAANFSVSSAQNFLVPSGGSASIEITHSGGVEGETATLTINHSGGTTDVSLTSGPAADNLPPDVTDPGSQQSVDGDIINLPIVATDLAPCTGLTYSATGLPPSLTIDPNTGIISGTLDEGSGSGTPGAFIESGGLVVVEMENISGIGGNWKTVVDATSPNINNPGSATGGDFLVWEGPQYFSQPGNGLLTVPIEISTPGTYRFQWRNQVGNGTNIADHNDSWLKIEGDAFYAEKPGSIVCPNGLDPNTNDCTATGTLNGASSGGWFKLYVNDLNWSWSTNTSDNDPHQIFARFDAPGTYNILISARSSSHVIDRMVLSHETAFTGNPTALSNPQSNQNTGGSPGASENSPYNVTVTVEDQCVPPLSTDINFVWNVTENPVGNPAATVEVTPGGTLGASTFGNDSFIITNTGDDNIVNVTINMSSGHMTDVVFDPVGTAGDSTAKCLTAGGSGDSAAAVGLTVPANGGSGADPDCTTPFIDPHNGVDNDEGFLTLTLDFTDFNPGESFAFGADMDPLSIKGDLTAGNAGSISGFEMIGAMVTIEFGSGVVYSTSLFDENSLGGSDAIVDVVSNGLVAPGIAVDASIASRVVTTANHTVDISGPPNATVTLLRVDSRMHIDPGNPGGVGYNVDPFEANEAMAKQLYTVTLDGSGQGSIPVVLTITPGSGGQPDGGLNHFIAVTELVSGENSKGSNIIVLEYDPNAVIAPSALVEITPGGNLGASTYSNSSFQITNTSTGGSQITNVTIDLSTAILPDMVFDPTGAGGDATSSCFTPNTGAATVGLIAPADDCVDPFSQPRFGGFDIISMDFNEFDPTEYFDFTVDVDPNSIQGVAGAGAAGAVSGYELIGATVTVTFSDATVLTGTLYEDGSLGGSQVILAESPPATPSITVVGVGTGQATVSSLNQTVTISGNPGDEVSLLVMDSRLFIASGDPPFNVPDETYYANEAMSGKTLYTGVIGGGGTIDIPITLLETAGGGGSPDGGLNQIIAVTSSGPYAVDQQTSSTSNMLTLLYDPNAGEALTVSYSLQGRTDYTEDLRIDIYPTGGITPVYQFTPTGSAIGEAIVNGIAPGTYDVAVKTAKYLQKIGTVTVVSGPNSVDVGQLLAGDVNDSNNINISDLAILGAAYNTSSGDAAYNALADLNEDGQVNIQDLALLAGNYNTTGDEPGP